MGLRRMSEAPVAAHSGRAERRRPGIAIIKRAAAVRLGSCNTAIVERMDEKRFDERRIDDWRDRDRNRRQLNRNAEAV